MRETDYFLQHLTLRQFQLLVAVVDYGGHSAAARELNITQPTISIQLSRMAEIVGSALFQTIGRAQELTETGQQVYDAARSILAALQKLDDEISGMQGDLKGELRICSVSTAGFIPFYLGLFLDLHPHVIPRLHVGNRSELIERIAGNRDDIFITGRVPESLPVDAAPIMKNELVVVASPDHPLAKKKSISLEQLATERLLLREPESGTRLAFETVMRESGYEIKPYMELGSNEAVRQAVMGGLGISVLSLSSIELEIASKRMVVIKTEKFPLQKQWFAVSRRGKQLPRAAREFLAFLKHRAADVRR